MLVYYSSSSTAGELFSTPIGPPSNNNFNFITPKSIAPHKTSFDILTTPNSFALDEEETLSSMKEIENNTKAIQQSKRFLRKRRTDDRKYRRKNSTLVLSESDGEVSCENQVQDRRFHDGDMPYIISGWLQLVFNLVLVAISLYIILQFIYTVQKDVDIKVEEYSAGILQEIGQCSRNYMDNRCAPPESRLPAMENPCNIWEACMRRDPTVIGRAKVSAETFAEILNNFVEPISYKTMMFFTLLIFGSLFLSNFAFGFLRSRAHHDRQYYSSSEAIHHPTRQRMTPRRTASRYLRSR
ncbi:hypothetical protein K7432_011364 [Basidiobolus ranarum]|uniref:Brl1/Brr6 domain-containing protein n=1 Tax=Basidiobolus ranarum TaxID=34480 RepID=A0ABR2VUH6_9FUNG